MNTIFLINIFLWSFILWHYYIKGYRIKHLLRKQLKTYPEFAAIQKIEPIITSLYNNSDAYIISRNACKKRGIKGNDFVYGEIEFLSFLTLLKKINPQPHDIFYDLGCGSGKAVLTTALCFNIQKACGVELLTELYDLANTQLNKARRLAPDLTSLDHVQFYNHDFLNCDFSDATILFINATCINENNWKELLKKIMKLPTETRIILTSKHIHHDHFKLLSASKELMSWGMNTVNIYKKIL